MRSHKNIIPHIKENCQKNNSKENNCQKEFKVYAGELEKLGEEIGVSIRVQHEEIFNQMHRI